MRYPKTNLREVMLLMFIGRLGPLTIAVAIAQQQSRPMVSYAEEQVMIG